VRTTVCPKRSRHRGPSGCSLTPDTRRHGARLAARYAPDRQPADPAALGPSTAIGHRRGLYRSWLAPAGDRLPSARSGPRDRTLRHRHPEPPAATPGRRAAGPLPTPAHCVKPLRSRRRRRSGWSYYSKDAADSRSALARTPPRGCTRNCPRVKNATEPVTGQADLGDGGQSLLAIGGMNPWKGCGPLTSVQRLNQRLKGWKAAERTTERMQGPFQPYSLPALPNLRPPLSARDARKLTADPTRILGPCCARLVGTTLRSSDEYAASSTITTSARSGDTNGPEGCLARYALGSAL